MTPATSRPCPWAGREGPRIRDKRPAGIAQNEDLTTFFCDNGRARSRIRRAARPPERAGSTKGPQEPRLSTQHRAPGAQVVPQVPRKMVTIFKFFINIKGQTELNFLRKKCPARCKKVRGMPRTANKDDPPLATGLFTPPHPRARFHSQGCTALCSLTPQPTLVLTNVGTNVGSCLRSHTHTPCTSL